MEAISHIDPSLTLDALLRPHAEGQYYERKSARLAPKDISKHISAFANANGGVIALGIEDTGEVTGLELVSNSENQFRQVPFDYLAYAPAYQIEMLSYLDDQKGYLTIMLFHVFHH